MNDEAWIFTVSILMSIIGGEDEEGHGRAELSRFIHVLHLVGCGIVSRQH